MSLPEIYSVACEKLAGCGDKDALPILQARKNTLEILVKGEALHSFGLGKALNYVSFFDKQGYCAIAHEYVKDTPLGVDGLSILAADELMTASCPKCGSETPYMQRTILGPEFWASYGNRRKYYPFVVHCGDLREIEHEFVQEKVRGLSDAIRRHL